MRTLRPQPDTLAPRLLPWFDRERRDLPWRKTHDPYRILVSEVMLQQTQVSRVVEYYRRFIREFPTCKALANAPLEEVLRHWAGLGYYARARNLQRACQVIGEEHRGKFPRTFDTVAALPGIGRYTAGAVLSIAFNQRYPAIDANVRRVLCRVLYERCDTSTSRMRMERFAEQAVSVDRPGDYNQALMEVGALICVSRNPRCPVCPLVDICLANRKGKQNAVPVLARMKKESVQVALAIVYKGQRVLLAPRPTAGRWGGLWVFPNIEYTSAPRAALRQLLARAYGLEAAIGEPVATVIYTFTSRRVTITAYHCGVQAGRVKAKSARWVKPEELQEYPLPSPHRKIAQLLQ